MTEQILMDKKANDEMLKNMRIGLVFYASLTRTRLKKKPEDYTVKEMLDIMDMMHKRITTKRGRLRTILIDLLNEPKFIIGILLFIIIVASILKGVKLW